MNAWIPPCKCLLEHLGIARRGPGFLHLLVRRYEADIVDQLSGAHEGRRESVCLCRATSASARSANPARAHVAPGLGTQPNPKTPDRMRRRRRAEAPNGYRRLR